MQAFRCIILMAALMIPACITQAVAAERSILMVLWRTETPFEAAYREALRDLGVQARITTLNAGASAEGLATQLREFQSAIESGDVDVIYSWGTTATRVVTRFVNNRVPVVFNVVFDPVGTGLVNSLAWPGGNVTGVTNGVPVDAALDRFASLFPLRSLCVMFNAREPNANISMRQAEAWALSRGVPVTILRTAPETWQRDAYLAEIRRGGLSCDALYAGADAFLSSRAREIAEAVGDRVRLLGGTENYVRQGWLAALAPETLDMGRAAALLTKRILDGADAARLPVVLPVPRLFMSVDAAARHGIAIPADAQRVTGPGT